MFETLANIIESLGMLDTMELLNVFLNYSVWFLDLLSFGLRFLLFFLLSTGPSRQPVFLAMCVSISASSASSSLATLSTSPRISSCSVIKAFLVRSKSAHNKI